MIYVNRTKVDRLERSIDISSTALGTYSSCARKFEWSRVDDWQYDGPKQANNMCLGSLTHFFLEEGLPYFLDPKGGPATATHNCANNVDSWIAAYTDNEMVQTDIYVKLLPYAKQMAANTFNWFNQTKFFDKYEFVSAEETYSTSVSDPAYKYLDWKIHCTADLIVKCKVTGTYSILDYKTGASLSVPLMNSDWQMNAMAVIMEDQLGPVGTAGHIRIKRVKSKAGKPPYVQLNEMRFSPERIKKARENIRILIFKILDDAIQLPNPNWSCESGCSFFDACESKSAGQDWEYVMQVDHKKGTDE